MENNVKVFWCEPNGKERRWLRRYISSDQDKCPSGQFGYHNAHHLLGDFDPKEAWPLHPTDDPLWPTACEACQKPFSVNDEFQKFNRAIYVRPDTGDTFCLNEAPVGACWNADWLIGKEPGDWNYGKTGSHFWTGPDGRSLIVRCPDGHDWNVDSRCSNCTKPDDETHFCWVRHGRPEDGTLHVDKNGNTCSAGAGSILTKNWHGFLHNGVLHT